MFGFSAISERGFSDTGGLPTNIKWVPVDDTQIFYTPVSTYVNAYIYEDTNYIYFYNGPPTTYIGQRITFGSYTLADQINVTSDVYYDGDEGAYYVNTSTYVPVGSYYDITFYDPTTTPIWTPIVAQG